MPSCPLPQAGFTCCFYQTAHTGIGTPARLICRILPVALYSPHRPNSWPSVLTPLLSPHASFFQALPAPSATIPYLSFTPAMLLGTAYLLDRRTAQLWAWWAWFVSRWRVCWYSAASTAIAGGRPEEHLWQRRDIVNSFDSRSSCHQPPDDLCKIDCRLMVRSKARTAYQS
jgi:hypothetical protein